MRDLETIRLALTAAETGHLVFARCTPFGRKTIDVSSTSFPRPRRKWCDRCCPESMVAVISQTLCKLKAARRVASHEIMIATRRSRT